jgi:hypothetical protein
MTDFKIVKIRSEMEDHQSGIELTDTTCAHYVYINFGTNKRICVRIPLEEDEVKVEYFQFFDDHIETRILSEDIHITEFLAK